MMTTNPSSESPRLSFRKLSRAARIAAPLIVVIGAVAAIMGWATWVTGEQLRLDQELSDLKLNLELDDSDIPDIPSIDLDSFNAPALRSELTRLTDQIGRLSARLAVLERAQVPHDAKHQSIATSLGSLYERTNILLYGRGNQNGLPSGTEQSPDE